MVTITQLIQQRQTPPYQKPYTRTKTTTKKSVNELRSDHTGHTFLLSFKNEFTAVKVQKSDGNSKELRICKIK